MKNILKLAVIAAAASLPAHAALAASADSARDGYAENVKSLVVVNSSGECVRTSAWSKDKATAVCDADLLPKMAAITPEPAPAAKPVMKPTVEKITLREDALFDIGKADLRAKGKAELDALVARINDKGITLEQVSITGHASATGPKTFNQILSERRAETVKNYLSQKGVDPTRIITQGMGETQPVASNATLEGRALNRRVEVEIKAQRTTMPGN